MAWYQHNQQLINHIRSLTCNATSQNVQIGNCTFNKRMSNYKTTQGLTKEKCKVSDLIYSRILIKSAGTLISSVTKFPTGTLISYKEI